MIAQAFGIDPTGLPEFGPRYNIAPSQDIPVVRVAAEGGRMPVRELVLVRWGLIPGWAGEPDIGLHTINARCETADTKPAFRASFKRRRCLVPADGFYEWKAMPGGKKQPYHITARPASGMAPSPTLFAMAGLWDRWEPKEGGAAIESCTILTTAANDFMAGIHNRMPVIVRPEEWGRWLDPEEDPRRLKELCRPYPAHLHAAMAVSRLVNSPRNETPLCLQPPEAEEPQHGLFD